MARHDARHGFNPYGSTAMESQPQTPGGKGAPDLKTMFRDLRRSNEYRARVARMLQEKRERHIEQVLTLQRKHRVHQSR